MTEIKINMPLYIDYDLSERQIQNRVNKAKGKKVNPYDRYRINLNAYCNWHPFVMNKIKRSYKDIVEQKFKEIGCTELSESISVLFRLYKGSNRRTDKGNFISIHEKFFLDAIVELGFIEDDNDDYIIESHSLETKMDKENPRMEIIIQNTKFFSLT